MTDKPQTHVRGEITGNDTIAFNGVTVKYRTPILHAARVVAQTDENAILDVYRNENLVCSWPVSKAAKLTVDEDHMRFTKYVPFSEDVKTRFSR